MDRPPVKAAGNGRVLYEGEALPHFNEVDECAGLDGLVTYRVWRKLGFDPENTLRRCPLWRIGGRVSGCCKIWARLLVGGMPAR